MNDNIVLPSAAKLLKILYNGLCMFQAGSRSRYAQLHSYKSENVDVYFRGRRAKIMGDGVAVATQVA